MNQSHENNFESCVALKADDKILKMIDTDRYNTEHSGDLSCLFRQMFRFGPQNHDHELEVKAIKNEVIDRLSGRSSDQVYALWQELGIDRETISSFMKTFAIKDAAGKEYDRIIPEDSAVIFLWFRYGIYFWDELGGEFGIYTYVWLYGFFFPQEIFAIPMPRAVTADQNKFFQQNDNRFCREMTMGTVIRLILLYQDEEKAKSRFFEPDITWRNSKIKCNPDWAHKLRAACGCSPEQ